MSTKLRVGFISQGMGTIRPPSIRGSVAIWTYGVARQLVKMDVDVSLYEYGDSFFRTSTRIHQKMRIVYIPTGPNRIIKRIRRRFAMKERTNNSTVRVAFDSPWHNIGFLFLAALKARLDRRSIIHIPNFSQAARLFRAVHPRARIVLHMHCEWLTDLDTSIIRNRLRATESIISCSQHISGQIATTYPERAVSVQTVFNGVDIDKFKPAVSKAPSMHILFVGRISPEKGIHHLVNAFRMVTKGATEATLELIGGRKNLPPEFIVGLSKDRKVTMLDRFYTHDYLDSVLHGLPESISEKIHVHGTIDHEKLPQWYRSSAVLAMPSLSEAFGIPVIEAMASGIPVVAHRVGGLPEIVVDGTTGYLVEPGDTEAFADALLRILTSEKLQSQMGEAGRKRARELFSWEVVTAKLFEIYKHLDREPGIHPVAQV